MKKINSTLLFGIFGILIPVIILSSCSTQQSVWGSKKDLKLSYRFDGVTHLNYQLISTFRQTMTIMEQPMEITSDEMLRFVAKPTKKIDNGQTLNVEIDEMTAKIVTPRGDVEEDLGVLKGKSFNMDLGDHGEEGSLSQARAITYQSTTGQEMNVASRFQAFFPNLPDQSVTMKENWVTNDTVVEETSAGKLVMTFEGNNRLIGYEKWNDIDCIKVLTTYNGTIDGTGTEQGMEMNTSGKLSGTETWYFAYKEGYYVKGVNDGIMEGSVTTSGAQEMVIPLKREYRMVVSLY